MNEMEFMRALIILFCVPLGLCSWDGKAFDLRCKGESPAQVSVTAVSANQFQRTFAILALLGIRACI